MSPASAKRKNRMPELIVAGLIFAAGATVWSQNLAPKPERAPEMAAADKNTRQASILPAAWKTATATERAAAQKIIVAQLEAFKKNKWPEAISYQSQNLKKNFATPEQFRTMMVNAYPQFVAYKTATFSLARMDGAHLQVVCNLVGQDGVKLSAIYSMIKENGKYRVDGVIGGAAMPPSGHSAPAPQGPTGTVV